MSETREHDGPGWRDNPDEYKPPVRRRVGFLSSRGYADPEIAAVKFGLADDIQRAASRLDGMDEVAARVRAAGVPVQPPDLAAILEGRVQAFPLERLMQVAAALGTTVTVTSAASKDGVGHVVVGRGRPRRDRTRGAPAQALAP